MTKRSKQPGKVVEPEQAKAASNKKPITLTEYYSQKSEWIKFRQWIIGQSPLITHAWSEKAKREMLAKMVKAVKPAKAERDPQQEFNDSLYVIGEGQYGFPVTAVKKCLLSVAHKDKGIAKTVVTGALWLDFKIIQARPALAGALCDMPIIPIYGSPPQMREDMVRIKGRGGSIANFAYRAQFSTWAMRLSGKFDPAQIPIETLAWLIEGGGIATGIGDWRNEKSGIFGAFRLAQGEEIDEWEAFAAGRGPLPEVGQMAEAAE